MHYTIQPGNYNPVIQGQIQDDYIIYQPQVLLYFGQRPSNTGDGVSCMNVEPGTGQAQRIGAKINVVKYQVKGTFTLTAGLNKKTNQFEQSILPDYENTISLGNPYGWIVRVIVMQAKNGDTRYDIGTSNYHDVFPCCSRYNNSSPYFPTSDNTTKILPEFAFTGSDPEFRKSTFTYRDLINNSRIRTMSMLEGITKRMRILYNKTYYVTPSRSVRDFKITLRNIGVISYNREIYATEESANNQNNTQNAICTMFIFAPISYMKDVIPFVSLSVEQKLVFTDP